MPSRPRSSLESAGFELRRDAILRNSRVLDTPASLSKTRIEPVFCTTYQRAELPGSCSIATGCEKLGRLLKTRCTDSDTALLGASPARQVEFAGRLSRPDAAGGGGGGITGGGVGVGTVPSSPPPLPQPVSRASATVAPSPAPIIERVRMPNLREHM